ncbi:unnamed protein product [Caenorhabditis angaria]|uniref:Uncharacterized protein n=1 Tax=Caenorhabditis angaria TaxID=860376 RepID=A0A9P1IR15_9PELO|nr:unnamed protein product [Caenorhabditis angaria]
MSVEPHDLEMSLNYFIRNGFELHPYFYNCTGVDSYALGVPRPFIGTYFLTVGIVLLMIYLPCLFVMGRSDLMKSSCYKIMFYLGIMDISCITVNSVATGWLAIQGATFCSYPKFIYVMGAIGCGFWMGSCATCILLALNRCCDINQNFKIRKMFVGNNIYIVMLVPLSYTIYSTFFIKPVAFNSNYVSWFFNPFIPGMNGEYYVNIAHTINNCCVSLTTTTLYVLLCCSLLHKSRHSSSEALSKTQRQIFIQSILICSINAIAAYIYVYMQFIPPPPFVVLIGQLAWQCAHGSVCIVYITMNRTIRRGVFKLFCPQNLQSHLNMKTTTITTEVRPVSKVITSVAATATSSEAVF